MTKEPRWVWLPVALALLLILVSTVRDGGWLWLGGFALIVGGTYACTWVASHRGYEWRIRRGTGPVVLPVMLVVLIVASSITGSFELSAMLSAVAATVQTATTSPNAMSCRVMGVK